MAPSKKKRAMGIFGNRWRWFACAQHFLKSYIDGHQRYEDRLSRWKV